MRDLKEEKEKIEEIEEILRTKEIKGKREESLL